MYSLALITYLAEREYALRVVQYATPFMLLAYYLLATLLDGLNLERPQKDTPDHLRKAIRYGIGLLWVGYLAKAGLITRLIFVEPSLYGSDPPNVHALSCALVWLIIYTPLLTAEETSLHPYYNTCKLASATELAIFALTSVAQLPASGDEYAILTVQIVQIIVMSYLSISHVSFLRRQAPVEKSPQDSKQAISDAKGGEKPKKASGSDNEDSDDEDYFTKRRRRGRVQIKKSLQVSDGWYNYIKDYAVFLPYVVPEANSRLTLNLIGVLAIIALQRLLKLLVPRQLGILISDLASSSPRTAYNSLLTYLGLKLLSSAAGFLHSTLWSPIQLSTNSRLEIASYNHIMSLSADFHDSKRLGETFAAMRQGQSIIQIIRTIAFSLLPDIVDLLIACTYFYQLFGPYMTLIGLATGIVYVVVATWRTTYESDIRRSRNKGARSKHQAQYDTVGQWKTVAYFNRIDWSKERFLEIVTEHDKSALDSHFTGRFIGILQTALQDLGFLGAAVMGVYQIMLRGAPVGNFVTLMNYWPSITSPLSSLSGISKQLVLQLVDAEALLKIWKTKPSVVDGTGELVLKDARAARVSFEGVHFQYPEKEKTIEDLSFEAQPGQTVALVGETGAGKTTILKLLFRFYDVSEGCIKVDGQDVRGVTVHSLRQNIGVVPQDPALFNTTLMDNLRYARLEATDEDIIEACKAAAIHEKILTFKKGYQSKVGEGGIKLSGGEKQRVAIARAMLKDAPIVLLDEATSSVDSETEEKIQEGLKRLCHGRTTFVVAHRLSTIQHADRILVIKDGGIHEQGAPKELFEKRGQYFKLWTKQMGIYDAFEVQNGEKTTVGADYKGTGETKTAETNGDDAKGDRKVSGEGRRPRSDKMDIRRPL